MTNSTGVFTCLHGSALKKHSPCYRYCTRFIIFTTAWQWDIVCAGL